MSPEMQPERPEHARIEPPPIARQTVSAADDELAVAEIVETARRRSAPVSWREVVAVLLLVALADLTIYRGHGFAGFAAFFAGAPLLLLLGGAGPRIGFGFLLLGSMILLSAARLLWCGSWLTVGAGMALLVAFAMALSGLRPYVLETLVYASQTVLAGYEGLRLWRRSPGRINPMLTRGHWLDVGLPLAALVAFGLLFIVANPDLLDAFGETVEWLLTAIREWIVDVSPEWQEVLFWLAVFWIAVGLLRPVVTRTLLAERSAPEGNVAQAPARAVMYSACRNTLATVIALFAVYLAFEFKTLWFRNFEKGFYFSGYAHQGAAWLTVALALATVVLSLIFRGPILRDGRLKALRRLAWLWSLENLLLAVAVYHRLSIYVNFNGMTRMRTVGLFGVSCVVVGLALVVWKIVHCHGFVWLLRRQLWALALAFYLYSLTPVDALVHSYNVRRILAGDPAPSIEISVHPISAEGVPALIPLVECDDEIIRNGIRAMLAECQEQAEAREAQNGKLGWTTHQLAEKRMLEQLRAADEHWEQYTEDRFQRRSALKKFHKYAYQWY